MMCCRRFALLLVLSLSSVCSWSQTRLACWNVENFYDTYDDTLTRDDAFTPQGDNHWTWRRFAQKRDKIYKTIAAMDYPVLFGLVEVENDGVLRQLCQATPLRKKRYEFVHYDSPDPRGVDCALLYRADAFHLLECRPLNMSDSIADYFTRDVLLVGGCLSQGDTLFVLVNHWPSKLGGARADVYRGRIAQRVCMVMDSLHRVHSKAWVVAMGDFNATPQEVALLLNRHAGEGLDSLSRPINLMSTLSHRCASYKYQGQWEYLDQMLYYAPEQKSPCAGGAFEAPWLVTDDPQSVGVKPFRTYQAMVYLGGVSDHLPVYMDFFCEE